MLLPPEVQSYIRHILHVIGMAIVAWSGHSEENVELWVGISVNAISLGWFLWETYKAKKKEKELDREFTGDQDIEVEG